MRVITSWDYAIWHELLWWAAILISIDCIVRAKCETVRVCGVPVVKEDLTEIVRYIRIVYHNAPTSITKCIIDWHACILPVF